MGLGGDVLDQTGFEVYDLQGADHGLIAGTGTPDEDIDLLRAMLLSTTGHGLDRELDDEEDGLARAPGVDLAGGGPGDSGTGRIGEGNNGVVERRLDVCVPAGDALGDLLARLTRSAGARNPYGCHVALLFPLRSRMGSRAQVR